MRPLATTLAAALVVFAGCSSAPSPAPRPVPATAAPAAISPAVPPASDQLDALAWYQTSEEARRLSQSVFASAARALEAALTDPGWSALGQGPEAAHLPPAIITDIDETILDNSALQGRFLADGTRFDERTFKAWVEAAEGAALPGSLAFVKRATERGVTIFYVSNRDVDEEPGTRRNLAREGFPLPEGLDVVLSRGERPEWGSDKESRRLEVARSYRVLLLLGDDLNDFLSGVREAGVDRRRELAEGASARWGTSWFVLPNPLYGSWERALVGASPSSLPPADVHARKRAALRQFDGELPPQ